MLWQIGGNPDIDHPDVNRGRSGKGIGAGTASQKCPDHRRRYLRGILRHALLCQTVIAGEHQQHAFFRTRFGGMPDHPETNGNVLDPSQRARRLGLAVNARTQNGFQRPIERLDQRQLQGNSFGDINSTFLRRT